MEELGDSACNLGSIKLNDSLVPAQNPYGPHRVVRPVVTIPFARHMVLFLCYNVAHYLDVDNARQLTSLPTLVR